MIESQTVKIATLENKSNEAISTSELFECILDTTMEDLKMAENNLESDKKKLQYRVSYLKHKSNDKARNIPDQRLLDQIAEYERQMNDLEKKL